MPHRAIAAAWRGASQPPDSGRPIDTHKILNGNQIAKGVLAATWATTICVVIIAFALSQVHFETFERVQATVKQSMRCRTATANLMISILDLETGQRGFLLTGDDSYLEPYQKGLSTVWERYSTLKDAFASLDASNELDALKELTVRKLSELQRTIMTRQSEGLEAAIKIVHTDVGKRNMETIRESLARIENFVTEVLARDQREVEKMMVIRKVTTITSLALIGASLVFGCLCYCLTDRRSEKERLAELELLLERAESAAKLKSAFVSTVSHELRTPMTGLSSIVDLLQKTHLGADQKELITIMNSSVQVMLRLINDILLFSKMESGRLGLVPQPTDVYRFLALVADPFFAVASQKSIVFRALIAEDLPSCVILDPDRLRQVIANLCDNALKFTPRCGRVDLSVRRVIPNEERVVILPDPNANQLANGGHAVQMTQIRALTDPDQPGGTLSVGNAPQPHLQDTIPVGSVVALEFAVIDNGIGIPKDAQESIFQPFTQAEATTGRRYGGTGLGLTISQQLVRLMGGKLEVHSEPGHGSTFTFTIPVKVATLPRNSYRSPSQSKLAADLKSPPGAAGGAGGSGAITQEGNPSGLPKSPHSPKPGNMSGFLSPQLRHGRTISAVLPSVPEPTEHQTRQSTTTTVTSKVKLTDAKVTDVETQVHTTRMRPGTGSPISTSVQSHGPSDAALSVGRIKDAATNGKAAGSKSGSGSSASSGSEREPLNVLVAEDSGIVQKVMSKMLTQLGFRSTIVSNGREALDLIALNPLAYDVVLMDVHMPVMDGLTATRLIRTFELNRSIRGLSTSARLPVLALTAGATEDEQNECLKAQMDGVITKPVSLRELGAALRRIPRRSAGQPQLNPPARTHPSRQPHPPQSVAAPAPTPATAAAPPHPQPQPQPQLPTGPSAATSQPHVLVAPVRDRSPRPRPMAVPSQADAWETSTRSGSGSGGGGSSSGVPLPPALHPQPHAPGVAFQRHPTLVRSEQITSAAADCDRDRDRGRDAANGARSPPVLAVAEEPTETPALVIALRPAASADPAAIDSGSGSSIPKPRG